jgi:hypothetical protein
MLNATSLRWLLAALVGWLDQRQQQAVAYLIEENRILRGHVPGRLRFTDEERWRSARHGHRLGRRSLEESALCRRAGRIRRRPRLGGLLNDYERAAR